MLLCLTKQYGFCATRQTDIAAIVKTFSGSPACVWDAAKAMKFISGRDRSMTSHKVRRSATDFNSLLSDMVDMQRKRISGVGRLMESMWNGTSTSGDGDSMNALLMAGMDDGPLDDILDDDLFDDDDGLGMAMLPALLGDKDKKAPLAPQIRIDGGGAAMQQGRHGSGSAGVVLGQFSVWTCAMAFCLASFFGSKSI